MTHAESRRQRTMVIHRLALGWPVLEVARAFALTPQQVVSIRSRAKWPT